MDDEHGSFAVQVRRISNGWLVSCRGTQKYCAEPHEVLAEVADGYGAHFEQLSISKLAPDNVASVGYDDGAGAARGYASGMVDLCKSLIEVSPCECPVKEDARLKKDKNHTHGCIVLRAERALSKFRNTSVVYNPGENRESYIIKKVMFG